MVLALVAKATHPVEMLSLCFNWHEVLLLTPLGRFILSPRRVRQCRTADRHTLLASASSLESTRPASSVTSHLILFKIQKMHCKGELGSWSWDKHTPRSTFHMQLRVIDEWVTVSKATCMSNKDQISAFLRTIPKNCKNSKLLITKDIIEGDRSRFHTLIGNDIPHLTLSIEAKEHGAPAAKHTIANTSSATGQRSDKRCRTGKTSRMTTGKCQLVDGKV